jgi:hypothetical protein
MKVSDSASFGVEKDSLVMWLERFISVSENLSYKPHPFLGKMNREEWGILVHKHIDHHLRQFGV